MLLLTEKESPVSAYKVTIIKLHYFTTLQPIKNRDQSLFENIWTPKEKKRKERQTVTLSIKVSRRSSFSMACISAGLELADLWSLSKILSSRSVHGREGQIQGKCV